MRRAEERTFTTHDGEGLFYRHWPAAQPARRAIVLFDRGHEHSGRLQHIVDELALDDCDMFAWDARGHGRSPGERGDSPSLGTSIKDVDTFVRHVTDVHGIPLENIAVIGQSVGKVLVSAWAHDYAPRTRCLVSAELPCASGRYACVPQLDLTVATRAQLARAVAAIDNSLARGPGLVLVCCALGYSRSAVAVAAWLVASGHAAHAAEAAASIRRACPGVVLHAGHLGVLDDYARARGFSVRAAAA